MKPGDILTVPRGREVVAVRVLGVRQYGAALRPRRRLLYETLTETVLDTRRVRALSDAAAHHDRLAGARMTMTYVVTEACIKCKYMDCVEVCPVDCFYEGENMLVIDPEVCIDCGVCEPECPPEAIKADTEPGLGQMADAECRYRQDLAEHHPEGRRRPQMRRNGTAWRTSSRSTSAINPVPARRINHVESMMRRRLRQTVRQPAKPLNSMTISQNNLK